MRVRLIEISLCLIITISLSSCKKSTLEKINTLTDVELYTPTVIENSIAQTESDELRFHLVGMEDLYNRKEFAFKDFELSEEWMDERPYYQFYNIEYDIKILVDESQEKATLYHLDQSIPIDLRYGITAGAGGTESSLRLIDLTGDDSAELILWGQTGGTGGVEQYIRIYNLDNMQEIKIEEYLSKLYSFLEITPIETSETNKPTFHIKTSDGDEYIRSINIPLLKLEDYEFTEACLLSYNVITVEEQSKIIDIEHGVTVKGAIGRDYLGIVKGTLKYNKDVGIFELVEGYYFK